MKRHFTLIAVLLLTILSCSKNNDEPNNSIEPKIISIGEYSFTFTSDFNLIDGQGIDSHVGTVSNSSITLSFDYGWYTRPSSNLPEDEYEVIEETINGYFKQLVIPNDPQNNFTKLHIYNIEEANNSPGGYNSLDISGYNLNSEQQQIVLSYFNTITIN